MWHRFFVFVVLLMSSITIATDDLVSDRLFKHHTTLAKNGNSESMFIVAGMYETGKGVNRDFSEAIRWYRSSAKLGNTLARQRVRHVSRKMREQFDK